MSMWGCGHARCPAARSAQYGGQLQVELLRTVKSLSIVEQSYARTKELMTNTVLTELEQLQQELIKAHGALQLAAAAVERTQQLSDKVVARKDLLAAQTEQQHARGAYDAALRKLRTYGVTETQIAPILNGGLDYSVLRTGSSLRRGAEVSRLRQVQ